MIKLLHGDCLELMKDIPNGSIDAIITDPPYGTTACKWDSVIPFEPMWSELKRIIKPNGAIVLFGSQPFTSALIMSNSKMFKYEWIWHKSHPTGFASSKKRTMKYHENILIFYKKQPTYIPQMTKGKPNHWNVNKAGKVKNTQPALNEVININKDNKFPNSVLYFSSPNRNGILHPTQKPVELIEYFIKTYTNENETVLDFTMGSGTTGVACKNLNRNFIGIELDEGYFNIAKERIGD
jgi:site-specific DNA-methyltransferase (adenine-specific)